MSQPSAAGKSTGRARSRHFDVIVVGAGPAGSTMAWALARKGVNVLVVDRATFPREKVCGDFVEPRGLRVLSEMDCLETLEGKGPLPISRVAMYLESVCRYQGNIPFYGRHEDLLPHGYIISRYDLDQTMLSAADRAGAAVMQMTAVESVAVGSDGVVIDAKQGGKPLRLEASLVVGADGCHSVVARSAGLLHDDPRYIAVSKRCYADGADFADGEAAFFFDRETFPGYAWMFPMSPTRANVGVGILSEARNRYRLRVPELLDRFLVRLRESHPNCANLEPSSRPIGGIVKTYGGAGNNVFERGILVGDAGCFVDPITGEGITPAMESALIGAKVLLDALEQGRFDGTILSRYTADFRAHFDPSMNMLDLIAAIMRNRHFAANWLKLVGQGCELAVEDRSFARTAGGAFGGMEVVPFHVGMSVWQKSVSALGSTGISALRDLARGNVAPMISLFRDGLDWQLAWWKSVSADPAWHTAWSTDVFAKWAKVTSALATEDPRASGVA